MIVLPRESNFILVLLLPTTSTFILYVRVVDVEGARCVVFDQKIWKMNAGEVIV